MISTITLNPSIDRRYNITDLKSNTVQRTGDYQATAGGKGINVSKVINLLDEKVVALGFLGGYTGEFIINKLNELNIENNFTQISGNTRTCINIIDKYKNAIEVLENGPKITETEKINFLKIYKAELEKIKVITISGSLPTGVKNDFYQKIINLAKEKDKLVILDSSGEALLYGLKASPDIIKPNKNEVESIVNFSLIKEDDFLKAGEILHNYGAKNIAITIGENGMYYFTKKNVYTVEVPEIKVVNATGSGDSVIAGLAVALKEKMKIEKMLKYASACGIANAIEKETGYIIKDNIEKYMKEIKVTKL